MWLAEKLEFLNINQPTTNLPVLVVIPTEISEKGHSYPFLPECQNRPSKDESSVTTFRDDGMEMIILGYERVYSIGKGSHILGYLQASSSLSSSKALLGFSPPALFCVTFEK